MSDSPSDARSSFVDLGEKPEAMLGALATLERDWEKMALAVEARLPEIQAGSTDAALLAAPLASEAGEPESASSTPLANSGVRTQSLASLARQTLAKGGASDASMAKESLAHAARGRAHTEELAEKLRQTDAAAAPVDLTDSVQVEEEAPAAVASAAEVAPLKPSINGNQLGYWVGAGGTLFALAAAVALWLRPAPAPLIVTQVVEQKAEKAPLAAAPVPVEPKAVEPDALARENAAPAAANVTATPSAPAIVALAAVASKAAGSGAGSAPSPASAAPAPDKIVLEDDAPPAPVAKAEANEAAGDKPATPPSSAEAPMRPADGTVSGSLQAKPSTGAVQSAMSGVMSAARRCVAGESDASSALIVFGSDGHVSSVTVSGAAAGKPAAACIQAALSRAKTQPFAEASFSFSATIRP
ncbi:MAG TPA: hypothetical protein VGI10_30240 [Polyangiaceae bacterium]|jgi:hypothetical protein